MINAIMAWSVRNRPAVLVAVLAATVLSFRAMVMMPVDAIPDLSENQVTVYADWPGHAPQEIEAQITQPLSLGLQGLAGVKSVRATSMFGFSLINVIFEDGVPSTTVRQGVNERLGPLSRKLPRGVEAVLGPDATGLGWVYQYYLYIDESKARPGLGELRALQDSFIAPQLGSVPGVAEVAGVGGFVKQFQVEVDSVKMRTWGITMNMVMEAVSGGNLNVGGRTIEENGMEFIVRGVGLLHGADDIGGLLLTEKNGVPVRVKDVARIEVGGDFRRGLLDVGGHEVVGGIVVMRTGANAREVIKGVKAKIARIQPALPDGVTLRPFYDRGELISRSLGTLKHALVEEVILVVLAHILFLWHFRSILIVTLPLPVSILVSFACLWQLGITSNLMSLCGIAIAIGVLVDGAIVLTENAIRRCGAAEREKGRPLTVDERCAVVLRASQQVGRPVFFAMAIIVCAFVPVFALSGQEGKLFHPLAFAKTFAMTAAAVLSITLVPALCTVLLKGPFHSEERNVVMRLLLRLYEPALDFALRRTKTVIALAGVALAAALLLARGIGSEFMPPLNEGSLLFMPTFVPGTSLGEVKRVMAWQDEVFASVPEVKSAVGKLGRAETATDPAPVEMIETTITLKPESEWRPGMTRQSLVHLLTEKMSQIPGSVPGFLQPIEGRTLMISTGVRAQLGVKLFGDDLAELQKWALEVEALVAKVPGTTGVAASRTQSRPYLDIEPDREKLARLGFRMADVLDVVDTGLGGREAGTVIEGRRRVPVQVRLQSSERSDITRLRDLLVTNLAGKVMPLGQLVTIQRVEGPAEIASENGRLRGFVQANVDRTARDLASVAEEVKARVAHEITPRLPKGITVEFSGEHENQLHARRTLLSIAPCVLAVLFLLLRQVYHSIREAAHVLLAVPFALSGGVFLQWALGIPFSVAVWVGYIALFGTAIQTAIIMVVFLEEAVARAREQRGAAFGITDLVHAVKDGARLRLRPKVMTVGTIIASLLPVLWSSRTGAEIMRPVAIPIIGGMASSLVHILLLTPAIFLWTRQSRAEAL